MMKKVNGELFKNAAIGFAIIGAGYLAYKIVRKVQTTGADIGAAIGDAVSDGFDAIKKAAGGAVDKAAGGVAAASQTVTQDAQDGIANLGMNIYTGQGLTLKPGGYKTLRQRETLTGGSMLLSDAEKAAIRRADAGDTGLIDNQVSRYQIFEEVGELKRAENRQSIYSIFD